MKRENVDAFEVELRCVDSGVTLRIVHRDLAEAGPRLLPVLRLEVQAASGVLDLDELLLPVRVLCVGVDVADVPIEGRIIPFCASVNSFGADFSSASCLMSLPTAAAGCRCPSCPHPSGAVAR